jgi:hypothetical protein
LKLSDIEGPNKLAGYKRESTRSKIITAWESYKKLQPGGTDRLFMAVREFAYSKHYDLETKFKNFGTAETADDFAQRTVADILRDLPKFRGDNGATFYAWVNRITFTDGKDAFNKIKKARDTHEPLVIKDHEHGEMENPKLNADNNPKLYESEIDPENVGFKHLARLPIPRDLPGLGLDEHRLIQIFCNTRYGPKPWPSVTDKSELPRAPRSDAEAAAIMGVNSSGRPVTANMVKKMKCRITAAYRPYLERDRVEAEAYRAEWQAREQRDRDRRKVKIRDTPALVVPQCAPAQRRKGWRRRELAALIELADLHCLNPTAFSGPPQMEAI